MVFDRDSAITVTVNVNASKMTSKGKGQQVGSVELLLLFHLPVTWQH